MTDRDRIDRFLSGLALLSEETGIGLGFGRPGNESSLVLTGQDGTERFQVVRLELLPAEKEERLSYELEFSGTIRISAHAAPCAPQDVAEAQSVRPTPVASRPHLQPSGSLVRVDDRFLQKAHRVELEPLVSKPSRASGE